MISFFADDKQALKEAILTSLNDMEHEYETAYIKAALIRSHHLDPHISFSVFLRTICSFSGREYKSGLDPTDEKQRKMAAAYLLEKVSWTGIASDFKISLTASRTQQLCDAMTVSKDLMANLLLSAGGRSGISTGGGGSNGELTNWDGTKKKTGWGM